MSFNKDTNLYDGYIYKIYSDINNKIYIGQTIVDISTRWSQHLYRAKYENNPPYMYKAMQKYGIDKFHICLLKTYSEKTEELLKEKLNKCEIDYISKYNTLAPNGYNLTIGGDNFGANYKIAVDMYNKKGELLNSFDSILEGARYLCTLLNIQCLYTSGIMKSCIGEYQQCMGYVWRYHGDPFDKYDNKHYGLKKTICCYDKNGNLLGTFESITDGLKQMKIVNGSTSPISACCKNKQKSAYGYIWRYADDNFDKYSLEGNRIKPCISVYSLNNEYLNTYNTLTDAIISIFNSKDSKKRSAIYSGLRRKSHNSLGYKWYYASDPNQPDKSKIIA